MEQVFALKHLVSAVVYSFLGVIILILAFIVFDALTPGKLWHEIVQEKNPWNDHRLCRSRIN
ncbi:MAG TPA: DUF350 domain-containing protein [Candidatus Melainabacteria bacterium]|nr:DUF350 domain-containing protein [Candidatus Melainabacteria bacterium]